MNALLNRIYGDYLMPSRLGEFEQLVRLTQEQGFAQQSLRTFFRSLAQAAGGAPKAMVHRHDIDTDARTAAKMFAIETRHGIQASYYFRLSTLDFGLMREIEAYGSEASYHYEEVATFAKRHHLKSAAAVRARMPEIRDEFRRNFEHIENALGSKLSTVASHGDFANRRLKVINHEILQDAALRAACGIECESYDPQLLRHFNVYISDRPYPRFYHPASPFAAVREANRICLLTHPVQWETNWSESTRSNLRRLVEGLTW
jgi:hypothetical protein